MAKSKDSRIAEIVRTRYNKLKTEHTDVFDEVEVFHQMYRSAMTQEEGYPWEYQYVDPQVFPLMRNVLARLDPAGMRVYLEAREKMDDEVRKMNQSVVNWELDENNKTMVMYRFLFRGLLAGRTYLSTGWRYEPAVVIDEKGRKRKTLKSITNRAEAKNVRFQDMFVPNQNIPDLHEQPYLVERISMPYGDMLDDNKIQDREVWKKEVLDDIVKKKMFSTKIDYGVDLIMEDGISKDERFLRSQYVSLVKMQTKDGDCFYILEDGLDKVVNTEHGSEYLHGHFNYVDWAPFPEDDTFHSMGIVQPVADLQEALSSTLNQYLTIARSAANPMTIINDTNKQTPDWMFVKRPNGVVRIKGDVNQVKEVTGADSSQSMLAMRQELQRGFERASSMSSLYSSGVATGAAGQVNTTARGAQIIDSNIDTNMQLLVSIFGAMALRRVGEHFLELNAQYMTEEQVIRITGDDGAGELLTVNPDETSANFDVIVSEDSMIKQTPQLKQATLVNIYTTLSQEKDVKLNKKPVIKALLDSHVATENLAAEVIYDAETMFQKHVNELLKGIVPEVTLIDDHKALTTLAQKHLMDNPTYPDEVLMLFSQYLAELRKWIDAANPNFMAPLPPAPPQMMPSNEQDLISSMSAQLSQGNPTQGQAVTIPNEQLI